MLNTFKKSRATNLPKAFHLAKNARFMSKAEILGLYAES
jgi:hypothetical protein